MFLEAHNPVWLLTGVRYGHIVTLCLQSLLTFIFWWPFVYFEKILREFRDTWVI